MAAPGALGIAGLGASLLGGLTGAVGAAQQASAQQQMYSYQSGIAEYNAKIAKQNADYALNQGEVQTEQYGIRLGQQLGAIKDAQAASGVAVGGGSASRVRQGQRDIGALDVTQIRTNAAKMAYNFDTQAVTQEQQSQLYKMAGANAAAAAPVNIASSILGSVASVSSKWLGGQQVGMFG